jgi:hypothetical protein
VRRQVAPLQIRRGSVECGSLLPLSSHSRGTYIVNYLSGIIRILGSSEKEKMRSVVTQQVNPHTFVAAKYYVPIILLVGIGATLVSGHPSLSNLAFRALLDTPVFLVACLLLSIAEIRVADRFFEYRRFRGWTKVPYDQIEHCRISWFPVLSYITLIPSEKNSARIYFVSGTLANERPRTEITKYINEHRSGKPQPKTQPAQPPDAELKNPRQFCLIMGLVGVLYSVLIALFFPYFLLEPDLPGLPSAIRLMERTLWEASTWPWALLTCSFLIFQILRLRYKSKAWISALTLGVVLGYMVTQALHS